VSDELKHSAQQSRIVTAVVLIAIAIVGIMFRDRLAAWFTGKSLAPHAGEEVRVQQDEFALRAALDPDPPGTSGNALVLHVTDREGHPLNKAEVAVEYQMPAMGAMAAMKGAARVISKKPGEYRAEFSLPMAGSWTLKTSVSTTSAHITQDFGLTVGTSGLRALSGEAVEAVHAQGDTSAIDHYTCSMHPSVHQSTPGKCPICGMDLIPVTKEQQAQGVVTIPPARQQLIGVRTSVVVQADMVRSLRVIGRLAYDESKMSDVSLKVRGWIVKLSVANTGQRVVRGETLFTLYSPELYAAQQDFLLASREQPGLPNRGTALAQAARQRLRLLDVSDAQIDEIARRGQPLENVTFTAREAGFVIEKDVVEGAAVEPGMRLYRIASLDKVWIEADVYEADFASVRVGQKASVTLDYLPGHSYEAQVAYVYPYLNAEARTGRARLELVNKKLELRPGMYANVQLHADLGTQLQVPAAAIVYTGPRRLVFVDLGEGRFRPQEVQVGSEADGMYEVLSGLHAGDRVATSGVFLIAAEARISTAAKYWESTETGEIGVSSELPAPAKAGVAEYTCPMHPEVKSATPGVCPKCGMDLVPRPATETP
jgi:Cu(I)/Ag(I) efflux system membrane fusion protein